MKHSFSLREEPNKEIIDRLIEICTADGSTIERLRIHYVWAKGLMSNDLHVKIWTTRVKK